MKRLISWVLSLVMILGMVPATAFLAVEASAAESVTYTYVQQKPVSIASSDTGTDGAWYNNGSTFVTTEGAANYIEIVEDGHKDAGALHVYQDNVTNSDMSLGVFIGGQAAGTYTLKISVKGDLGLSGQTCKFYPYGCFDLVENIHTALGTDEVSDWTEVTYENITVASDFYYLIFSFSKYNWATDMYVDNVQLINSSGVDVLAGAGDFCTLEEVSANSADTNQWPLAMDTSKLDDVYDAAADEWVPFTPYAAYQDTWPAWEDGVNYGQIAANGYKDAGSLHLVSAAGKNVGAVINPGMVSGESYTIGMWVKGTANSNKMLAIYGNGDPCLIGNPEHCGEVCLSSVPAEWTYIERTFTANRNSLAIFAADWGVTDIYIDNITLVNSAGVDLLAGYGDFYVYKEVFSIYDSDPGEYYKWYNGNGYTATDDMYIALVEEGADDPGAIRVYQKDATVAAEDMRIHLRVDTIPVGTYTLQYNMKSTDLGNYNDPNNACRFYLDADSGLTTNVRDMNGGTKVITDWTAFSETITTTEENNYIILGISKYVGGADFYLDNVKLLDANGNDLMKGQGNFCIYEPITIAESNPGTNYEWYNHNGYVNNDTKVLEIVEDGANDAGSVHVYQPDGQTADADMVIGIRVDCVPTGTYTLQYNIKGTDLGNTDNNSNKFYLYGNDTLTNQFRNAAGAKILSDWTTVTETFTTTSDVYYIYMMVSKYVNGADYYVDNVKLLDADGKDMLNGTGNFCVAPVSESEDTEPEGPNVPTDDVVSGTADVLDTGKHSWAKLSHMDAWTPFFPAGISADTNWTAWETESENETGYNYAEIAAIGKSDAGSLHFVRGDVYENVGVALEAGLIPGNSYTLKAYVKGYAKAAYGGLQLYGNSDVMIATFGDGQTVENNTNWQEVTATFTADRSSLELYVGGGAYLADIYVDDLQIIDSTGKNVLDNKGNFSVIDEDIPDLAIISSEAERAYRWYWNAPGLGDVTLTPTVDNNVEIIAEGAKDPGALVLWQNAINAAGPQDNLLTLIGTQANDLTNNQTYTLSMNVKGVFGNIEQLSIYPAYLDQTQAKEQLNIPNKLKEVLGITCGDYETFIVPEWTTLTWELPYNDGENGFTYLNLFMSKYTWGTHCFIDNVQVLDPNGNDVLGGAGNFMDSGSESYPIRLADTSAEILNSNTMYYMAYVNGGSVSVSNHVESGYTAGDQNFSVTHNGVTQAASSKNVTMNVAPSKDGMPVIFSITSNAGSIDIPSSTLEAMQRAGEFNIYDISFSGYSTETETLTLGSQELGFVWGDSDGYSYTYTPAEKGTLNVAVESGNVNVILSTADSNGSASLDVDAGETVTVQIIPAQNANGGHIATDAVITSSFTEYVCQHTNTETVTVNASCTAVGSTTVTCTDCGEVVSVTELPITDHSWNEGEITTAPGCESEGVKTYTCSVCGETKTEAVSAAGHTEVIDEAVTATLTTAGKTEGKH